VRALAEWCYEAGIGENRAILVEDGAIVEAQIELPGLRAGTVAEARLTSILIPGKRGIATLFDGSEVLIEPLHNATEGVAIRVEIIREAISEPGAIKRAKGRLTDAEILDGPDLAMRIGPHRIAGLHDPDLFEEAGWSECLEEAALGVCRFPEGWLRISLTPAMALIDVDGPIGAERLALAGAKAAARAIRRFGLAGNIGIDLPTVAGKSERLAIAAAFDAELPRPYERTGVNGFGFLQVIRPRVRASLSELASHDAPAWQARALLRQVQRSGRIGATKIEASPAIIKSIGAHPQWIDELARYLGGPVTVKND
jgi:hypothetical protein